MSFEFDPDALRRIRRERGVTQQQLADMVGRDVTTVSQYERGRYGLSVPTLAAIAAALGASMDDFIKAADDRELVSV